MPCKTSIKKLCRDFDASQVYGYDCQVLSTANIKDEVKRIALADEFCTRTQAKISHFKSERAYYDVAADYIHMPDTTSFQATEYSDATDSYYITLMHELIHWSGAQHRLNRIDNNTLSGKFSYAYEEIVAELGSAMLCAQLNIIQQPREDHLQYIKIWLGDLKNDNRYIFQASADAARAVDYLNQLQPEYN